MGPDIIVIADDLTGALEVGAQFALRSISTVVTTECSFGTLSRKALASDVIVFDTESRHLPAAQAALRAAAIAGDCRQYGIDCIYKKTDSTLRGNIGAELGALLASGQHDRLFYVPAYPQLGRTTKAGCLYVNQGPLHLSDFTNDPLEPVTDSTISRLFDDHVQLPVVTVKPQELPANPEPAIYIIDGETRDDVAAAAAYVIRRGCWLAAGPAGLAREIAHLLGSGEHPGSTFNARQCLVINGSLHPVSHGQTEAAMEAGWPEVNLDESSVPRSYPWSVCKNEGLRTLPSPEYMHRRGALICDHLRDGLVDCLVIFGGDTAYAMVNAMGAREIEPLFELLPGIPLSRVTWCPPGSSEARDMTLVTKAGGFGSRNTLLAIRNQLQQESL
jgi:uncharacterized protein YgbK (DUF1537 family)